MSTKSEIQVPDWLPDFLAHQAETGSRTVKEAWSSYGRNELQLWQVRRAVRGFEQIMGE